MSKSITVGVPHPVSDVTFFTGDPLNLCPNTGYSVLVSPQAYTKYEWILPYGWDPPTDFEPYINYDVQLDLTTGGLSSGIDYIFVYKENACGLSEPFVKEVSVTGGDCFFSSYTISPNPANNRITITSSEADNFESVKPENRRLSTSAVNGIREVRIYSINGKLEINKKFSNNKSSAQLDVSKLASGTYIVEISGTKSKSSQKIIIQR